MVSNGMSGAPSTDQFEGGGLGTNTLRRETTLIVVLGLCVLALLAVHWYWQHEREIQHSEENHARLVANRSELEAELGKLKAKWLANDDWEKGLTTRQLSAVPYSIDVERALIKGYPLIFYGTVEDIRTIDGQALSSVKVHVYGQKNFLRLRLLLEASPELASEINKDDLFHAAPLDELSKVSIFVATIDDVQRVPAYNSQGDDVSYFVARGTLQDAFASRVYEAEFSH
jgi:hypothetical protein